MIDVKDFLSVTRDIIEQQIRDRSTDAVCEIESVNEDGTLNIFVLPDKQTILKNIINESRYNFKRGDNALLYKIHNRLSDSFVVAKFRPKQEDAGISEKSVQNLIDNALQNYQGGSGGGVSGGIQGPPGPQGIQGEIGPTGPTGAAGENGSIGPTGEKGEIGSTGPTGAQGNTGSTGPTGAVGPTGPLNKEAFVDAKVSPTGTVVFTKDNGNTVALQFAQIQGTELAGYNIHSYNINKDNGWTGTGPYTHTMTAENGGWVATQDILVQLRLIDGTPYEGVHAKYAVGQDGTVTVTSDAKLPIQVLVADGLVAGPRGLTGPTGPQGLRGEQGAKGDAGATGPTGDVGPVGPTGETGAIGPTGPIDEDAFVEATIGSTGVVTFTKQNGQQVNLNLAYFDETAVAGYNIHSYTISENDWTGTAAPYTYTKTAADGNWVATQNLLVQMRLLDGTPFEGVHAKYTVSANGSVTVSADSKLKLQVLVADGLIAGPKGEVGATGPQGLVGPTGATGALGPTGSVGPTGEAGVKGDTGAVGPTGQTGPIGPTGKEGALGPTGPTGSLGPTGPLNKDAFVDAVVNPTGTVVFTKNNGQTVVLQFAQIEGSSIAGYNIHSYKIAQADWSGTQAPYAHTKSATAGGWVSTQDLLVQIRLDDSSPYEGIHTQYKVANNGDVTIISDTKADLQILVADGLVAGAKGDTGPIGPTGPKGEDGVIGKDGKDGPTGPTGPVGPTGAPGLTTKITVNGTTYTQSGGNITLPDYAKIGTSTTNKILSKIEYTTETAIPTTPDETYEYAITDLISYGDLDANLQEQIDHMGNTGPTGPTGSTGPTGKTGAVGPTGPMDEDAFVQATIGTTGVVTFTKQNGQQVNLNLAYFDSTAIAGYNIHSYTIEQWTGTAAPYTHTKTAADGGWTATQNILVQMRAIDATPFEGIHAKYTVSSDGTVIVSSDSKIKLQILVADGLVAGPKGEIGPTGPKGNTGNVGPTGQTGAVGPTGQTGAKGDTGAQGPKGDTGPQGPKGDTGVVGPTGQTGAVGPTGERGPQGEQGIQGPQGNVGPTGQTGPQGDTGPIGPTGQTGNTGPTGPTGAKGPTGPLDENSFVSASTGPTGTVVFTKQNGQTVALQFGQIAGTDYAGYNIHSYDITTTSWTGTGPYTHTKTAADGGWTPTKDILVQMRLSSGTPYEGVHAKYTVSSDGTVIVTSDTKLALQILVADGLIVGQKGPTGPQGVKGNTGPTGTSFSILRTEIRSGTLQYFLELQNKDDYWTNVTSFSGQAGDVGLLQCQITDRENTYGYMLFEVSSYDSAAQTIYGHNHTFMYGPAGPTESQRLKRAPGTTGATGTVPHFYRHEIENLSSAVTDGVRFYLDMAIQNPTEQQIIQAIPNGLVGQYLEVGTGWMPCSIYVDTTKTKISVVTPSYQAIDDEVSLYNLGVKKTTQLF